MDEVIPVQFTADGDGVVVVVVVVGKHHNLLYAPISLFYQLFGNFDLN